MAACWRSAGTGRTVPPTGCCRRARRPRGPEHRSRAQSGDQRGDRRRGGHRQPLQVLDSGAGDERQYFYLGRISTWDFAAHRAGVQRARTRHLPAGADPADRRRAGSHRPQADRGRRAASRCYRRGPRPVHAIGPAIRPGRASTSWDLKAIALVPRCPFGIGRYISRTNRGVCSGPGARLPVSVRACS